MIQKKYLWLGCALMLPLQAAYAGVSGTVFHDVNDNGVLDSGAALTETGIAGVTITATDATGTSVTTTSGTDGSYSFPDSGPTAAGNDVRLEFSDLPLYVNNGTAAYGTNMRFVQAGGATDVNLALTYAENYCQSNPKVATPMFIASEEGGWDNLMTFSYQNEGLGPADTTGVATSSQVGALWGVAYSRSEKKLYASAVLKGHTPLGAEGLDVIYQVDPFLGTPNATPWLELTDDLGIAVSSVSANPQYADNTARGLDAYPQNDAGAFVDVLKVGIGDIELSADEKILYLVNVYDKKLYAIDVATKTVANSYTIPNPGCSNGEARPWALAERLGEVYVGVTCDASASGNPASLTDNAGVSNLKSSIYRLDGLSFTQVLDFPLDYPREPAFSYDADPIANGTCNKVNRWQPWSDTLPALCADGQVSYPTPLLTDIEFDDNSNMILGFTDRTGFQIGHANYGPTGADLYSVYAGGDILKACKTTIGWDIEGPGVGCESSDGLSINQNDPNGYPISWDPWWLEKAGEFYEGDYFHSEGGIDGNPGYFPGHPEITIGGLAVLPLSGEVMSVSYDPVTGAPNYGTGGVITLNNETGKRSRNGFQLYENTDAADHTAAKGVGLGDLELLCDPPPIEVGNRIWLDANENGIQDVGEAGIDGVDVFIGCGANSASVTTSNGGEFLFSSATNATFLAAGESCTISVISGQTALNGLAPTVQDADNITDNNSLTDIRDSDATSAGEIVFTVGSIGENNHGLDLGYKTAPVLPDIELSKTVDKTSALRGEQVVYTLTVSNAGAGDATGVQVGDLLPAGISHVSNNPEQGTYTPGDGLWDVGSLPAGMSVELTITATVD